MTADPPQPQPVDETPKTPTEIFLTKLSHDAGYWSVAVSVAVGITFAVGAALLTARLYESYGVTPYAVLTSLPRGFVLQTGIEDVLLPAFVAVLALRVADQFIQRSPSGRPVQRARQWLVARDRRWAVLLVVLGAALPAVAGLFLYPARLHPIGPVQRFVSDWVALLLFLWVVSETYRLVRRSPRLRGTTNRGALAFALQLLVIGGFIVAVRAYLPLPEGIACGTGSNFTYIYATSDTVYAVQLFRSEGKAEKGSGSISIIPMSEAKTTVVGTQIGVRNCRTAASVPVVVNPSIGASGAPVLAIPQASPPVAHMRAGSQLSLGCIDQPKTSANPPRIYGQISSPTDNRDWVDVDNLVLPDGTGFSNSLVHLPPCG